MTKTFYLTVIAGILILGGNMAFADPPRSATISKMKGTVSFRSEGGHWQAAEKGMVFHEKDEIRTAPGASAEILLDDNAQTGKLELREKSHLRLSTMQIEPVSKDKTTFLDLAMGSVLVHAEKLQGESTFRVRTPTSTTGVRGTVFEVKVEEE